jgi:hypothetical protein
MQVPHEGEKFARVSCWRIPQPLWTAMRFFEQEFILVKKTEEQDTDPQKDPFEGPLFLLY